MQCSQGHVWLVARTASRTHRLTENSWTCLVPIPSPKHIIPNHPFYFFAFGKKVVDVKNRALISRCLPIEAIQRAAQKFIKFIGRLEPRAWCSDKWYEMHWQLHHKRITNVDEWWSLRFFIYYLLLCTFWCAAAPSNSGSTLGRGGMLLYRPSLEILK